jgi:hypothetical protein
MESHESQAIMRRIANIESEFRRQKERSHARNSLESHIYHMNAVLETSEFDMSATEEESKHLQSLLSSINSWLHDEANSDISQEDYLQKLQQLETLEKPILRRLNEHEVRPRLIADLKHALEVAETFVNQMLTPTDQDTYYSKEDLNYLSEICHSTRAWLNKKEQAQSQLSLRQDPILTVGDLQAKLLRVQSETHLLQKKPKHRSPPKTSTIDDTHHHNLTDLDSSSDESNSTLSRLDHIPEGDAPQSVPEDSRHGHENQKEDLHGKRSNMTHESALGPTPPSRSHEIHEDL